MQEARPVAVGRGHELASAFAGGFVTIAGSGGTTYLEAGVVRCRKSPRPRLQELRKRKVYTPFMACARGQTSTLLSTHRHSGIVNGRSTEPKLPR